MTTRLRKNFYQQDTHTVAKLLLGKLLVSKWRNQKLITRINEVECYIGENDKACHAAKGKTKRNAAMFKSAGHAYVYFIYGMYHCLNIVTEKEGFPAAVLIRGGIPLLKTDQKTDGPGKLCRALHITRAQNGANTLTSARLYITDDGFKINPKKIVSSPRIGVDYAGADALLPWRYHITSY